ncbi:isopentenyl-diphosphate Delta-isomerase [Corynebacterium pelargi]|uniref:Isopentenyl-diphosphate Delta-isomerase n=1 Tax=Corynebacterium pelargi TaxID=1471400 RepID=A0A410W7A4_9CORY|nr:isopentenyl-diphosphate Delta-isomerase [Corynebacterium pelargi]QAU51888.1 Isopentenyl-diphosphate Delta-isomerase [Corynebacterium pelargi]GGG71683.1 isopentenyl-diphosphate Delta-isomerase [Corynebacterium pelargi]
MHAEELVVLADAEGNPTGTALKATVHTTNTPLHLAFSCYVLNSEGQLLLTRRALDKKTWPGVWTNSACGHLAPEESPAEAVARRVPFELGIPSDTLVDVTCVLPNFRYKAVDANGIVEWEICPVFIARTSARVQPEPEEVAELEWVAPDQLIKAAEATPFAFSPWMVEQLQHQQLRSALLGNGDL